MKYKKLLYTILSVFVLTLVVTGTTYAASNSQTFHNHFTQIAEAIAKKFNLSTADVQTVINETMATQNENWPNRPNDLDKLAKAVTDGKLTQAQVDLIKAKREALKTAMESLKDLSQEERMTAMKTQTDALKQWATDNNIPLEYVMGRFGVAGPGAGRGGMNEHRLDNQGQNNGQNSNN